ncbi:hypothetical protein [Micromonospora chersina]|uniref:hypothetical protein n=1 Tax=Micromonospora chersina TaxID=47854 RepID=UPI00372471A8
MERRLLRTHDILRYARDANSVQAMLDGYLNYYFVMSSPDRNLPRIMLERGINAPANVHGPDGVRRPVIALRSSPWKAGHATNPWHDEFDLDYGHVRYYGDHKVDTPGSPGVTAGNKALLEAGRLHTGNTVEQRLLAPPLLLFRSKTVERHGQTLVKGHVEFCGVGVIERIEPVVQQDPVTCRSFPNLAVDITIIGTFDRGDAIDMRWIDDRRNLALDALQANRHAPLSWSRWVRDGRRALPHVRRSVIPAPRPGA